MGHLITDSALVMRESAAVFIVISPSLSGRLQRGHGSVKRPHASQVIKELPSTSIISLHGSAMRWIWGVSHCGGGVGRGTS